MICARATDNQDIDKTDIVQLTESQSTSCSEQLRANQVLLSFPGVYAVQFSITGRNTGGRLRFQLYNSDTPVDGAVLHSKGLVGETHTLTSAPLLLTFKNEADSLSLSIRNIGGKTSVNNATLTAWKVF